MAIHQRVDVSAAFDGDGGSTLWVEIGVDVEQDAACPLSGRTDPSASGSVQLVGETCHVSLRSDAQDGEDTVRTYTTPIAENCPCLSLCHPGCVPEVLAVKNGSLAIGAYADSRETLGEVMDAVRETAASVRLERLTTADTAVGERHQPETVEDVSLTEKQREAVRTAVEMGYYQSPRNASLDDLADRVGVSKSAFSQRLNAVETKLITALASEL